MNIFKLCPFKHKKFKIIFIKEILFNKLIDSQNIEINKFNI